MIVVLVLITSCQTSEKPNIGPVAAHARISTTAAIKAQGEPIASDALLANLRNASFIAMLLVVNV
jgi:hypothetical protein